MTPLQARLTRAHDGGPLAIVGGLPGDDAALRPAQRRRLAAALLRVADDAEGRKRVHRGRPPPDERRADPLAPAAWAVLDAAPASR